MMCCPALSVGIRAVVTLLIGVPLCLVAAESDWSGLAQIAPGEKAQVVRQNMKSVHGRFESFTPDSLVIRQKTDSLAIPKNDILRVTVAAHGHRIRNSLIGAGAGAAVGYGIGRAGTSRWNGGWGLLVTFSTLIGAGGGAGLGSVIPSYPTVYRAQPPARVGR